MVVCDGNTPRRKALRANLLACLLGALSSWVGTTSHLSAQQSYTSQWSIANAPLTLVSQNNRQKLEMVVNTSREIIADQAFSQIRIHNQEMVNALPLAGGNRMQISALKTGVTQVDLLGVDESVSTLEVMVLGDVRELESIIQKTMPEATIELTPILQGIIINGFVGNADDVNTIERIAAQYFPNVINRVTVMGVHTIQLQTQIMEVSRTKLRVLGIDSALFTGTDSLVTNVAGTLSGSGANVLTTGNQTFSYSVIDGKLLGSVEALRRNNLVKVLASPVLTAQDGRPASFNAGGEIPIIVPAGLGQVAIQFREFGTRLDYVAKVLGNGKIYLEVRPYVSEIDPTRSVEINGISVPGLRSRFLETGVELQAGQTLALAGLLQVRTESISSGIPGLADVPYLGVFFRKNREEQNEIELLITVTPDFAGPMSPGELPSMAPGMNTDVPTDKEFYFKGYMETPLTGTQPGMSPVGLYESAPAAMNAVGAVPFQSPHPSAMSIGPNAPTLAETQFRNAPGTPAQTAATPTPSVYR